MERRLAAILSYDVVGYSRAMGMDESGTLERLKAHRREAISPHAVLYGGRTIKLMGDGALMEFASAVDAVAFAVVMQFAVAKRDSELDEGQRLLYRIGINVGDVIVEGDDIYGDGVNVAARLEGLAEPGGICIQRNVRNHVRGKLDLDFTDLGEVEVKNIDRPIRAFHVVLNEKAEALGAGHESPSAPKTDLESPHVSPGVARVPIRPSIAVLPFVNMAGDADQEHFSDGLTEDVITELSRFRSLLVIARTSSFLYKNRIANVREIGSELGVNYIVEGSVRRAGDRVRVTVQLIDAATGSHVWAERYDRDLSDLFSVLDEVVRSIVTTLAGQIEKSRRESAKRKPPSKMDAYDYVLRGREHYYRWTFHDNRQARTMFERAIAIDPEYAAAYAGLSKTHYVDWLGGWSVAPHESFGQFCRLAEKAVALDEYDSRAHTAMGSACLHSRQFERGRYHLKQAVMLNPSDVRALVFSALLDTYTGNPTQAIDQLTAALRVNPFGKYGWYSGRALYVAQRYDHAIAALENLRDPQALVHAWIAASYAQSGRRDRASAVAANFVAAAQSELTLAEVPFPESWLAFIIERCPFQHENDLAHFRSGLHAAGFTE